MARFYNFAKETTVLIPRYLEVDNVVFYEIKVQVKDVQWSVQRRYNEFHELNDKLVEDGVPKKLLPPKKLVGNKNPSFIEQRRSDLEEYLKNILGLLRVTMPRPFLEFLDFNKYDIVYLLQDLAKKFNESGDSLLLRSREYNFSALELFAISERMYLPCPEQEKDKYDFSHVLDFCSQLESIRITPVMDVAETSSRDYYNTVDVPIGTSNLIPKNLTFHLNAFRNLTTLIVLGLSTENIVDISVCKANLKDVQVHNTVLTRTSQILTCDKTASCSQWENLTNLDLSGNLLTTLDTSIELTPRLKTLTLDQNRLDTIQHLNTLSQLQVLSLSMNVIANCLDWHLELGNIVTLNLAQNKLKSLSGLRKLYSLVNLDLSFNSIDSLEEVDNIAQLPLLENLRLNGNPLAGSVDYRPRVFARFNERANEVYLDSEKGTPAELDMALVLSALTRCSKNNAT